MASCTKIEHSLQSFIDGELSDSERLILENHLHDCPSCCLLLKQHTGCNADIFESFVPFRYQGDMTSYVMEHLPEMITLSEGSGDLEQVNRRAKHPAPFRERFNLLVPLAAAFLIVGLGFMLKESWPEADIPDAVLGAVTYQKGSIFRIASETEERSVARLRSIAQAGDRFETGAHANMMISLLGPTEVKLAPNSRIRVHDERRISVEKGRVFLDVAKGNRVFRVLTPNGTVTVFGTSFEVYVQNDETTVSVVEGEVQVERGELFTQVFPGEQVHVTQDMTTLQTISVDIESLLKWTSAMRPDEDAMQYFTTRIATAFVPDVVQADSVYHLQTHGHAINYVELEWEPNRLNDLIGYQVYVYSDKDILMFKGALNASTLAQRNDSTIRIYNQANPQLRTRFAFVKIVADTPEKEGDLTFTNCNANLLK